MFGGGFSRIRFSLRSAVTQNIPVKAFFIENIKGLLTFGEDMPARHDYRLHMNGRLTATSGVAMSALYSETINASATARANYVITNSFLETLSGDIYVAADINTKMTCAEEIRTDSRAGANISLTAIYADAIKNELFIGKNIQLLHHMREALFSSVSSAILDRDIFIVNITLPPGAELRIDSQNYTVTLNGENIIDRYDGDWIHISRELVDLAIDSGGAELTGALLYTERYL